MAKGQGQTSEADSDVSNSEDVRFRGLQEPCGWLDALCSPETLDSEDNAHAHLTGGWRQVGEDKCDCARTSVVRARCCVGPGRRTLAEGTTCFQPPVESELWRSMQEMWGYGHSCGHGLGHENK